MKVIFLGTGAAEGIPAIFCNCKFCKEARQKKEIRSRAQILLDGELSIDFPPDAFYHGAAFGQDLSAIKYIVITHSHMDHFYAHDFVMRGYKYAYDMTSPQLAIYANPEVLEVFSECTRRELKEEVKASISLHPLHAFEKAGFGGWQLYTLAANHNSQEPLLYLLEKDGKRILHLTDTGVLPEADWEFLKSVGGGPIDLVILDCTFLFAEALKTARHMGLNENKMTAERLKEMGLANENTRFVITHFSHNGAPTKEKLLEAERQYGYIAAYDGMEIEI